MKKPLIVTDKYLAELGNGPVAQSIASLKENGIEYAIFTGAEANPKVQNC